jgi:hypothetical protein
MEDSQAFARRLETALDAKRDRLDRDDLPRLKNSFKLFQTAFEGVYGVLYKKGIVHEDPYKYEIKISEVTTPSEAPFPESEKFDQLSVRLSQFGSYLDFLNNYYQFSADFLGMGRIKRLLALVKYFNFTQFTDTSTNVNTRCLAEMVSMVKRGSDQLSSGILAEGIGQLDRATREILAVLKDLAAYHRERYKLELRDLVGASLGFEPAFVASHREDALRAVKRKFAEVATEKPFYPELADEFLMEDYSTEGPALREEVLRRFEVATEQKVEKAKERSYKAVILEGIRVLAGVNYTIEGALQKLSEASTLLEAHHQGFLAKLSAMLRSVFSPGDKGIHYDIEIIDTITGARKHETVDFPAFVEEGSRRAKALAGLLQKNGPTWRRIETLPDDQAFKFLEKTMEELQLLLKRMNALEEFFRSAVTAEDRSRLRSVKTEVTSIKGALIKANQKKHEYVAQMEEVEQLRRLGISRTE